MKKFATLAVLASLAAAASAATISWGFGGNAYVSEDGTSAVLAANYTGETPAGYLALVYVGQNVSSLTDDILAGITDDTVVSTAPYAMGTGRNTSAWVVSPSSATVSGNDYSIGATFAVVYYNGSEFDYVYSVSSGSVGSAFTGNTLTLTDLADNAQAVSIFATRTAGANTVGAIVTASTPPVVPEPSVALMGLLGLGMMLKRRRA